jgi:hypothetical protein
MTREEGWLRLELLVEWGENSFLQERFARDARRTADPSTTLRFGRDDKGRGVAQVGVVSGMGRKQVPSGKICESRGAHFRPLHSLRFGRDDKGRGVALVGVVSGMGRNSATHYTGVVKSCGKKC